MIRFLRCFFLFLIVYYSSITSLFGNNFTKYTTVNGLSSDIVDAIAQDEDGYIYIGTPLGLNVFNGTSFKIYNTKNTKNFSNQIKCILPINNQIILIGSLDNGLYIYNKRYGSIIPIKIKDANNILLKVTALLKSEDGTIWIGSKNNGLLKITAAQINAFVNQPDYFLEISDIKVGLDKYINCIFLSKNILWVGTLNNGLYKYEIQSPKKHFIPVKTYNNEIWDLKSHNNKLYIAQFGGLEIIDLETEKHALILQNSSDNKIEKNTVTSITLDDFGRLWVSTLNNGLYSISTHDLTILEHFVNNVTDSRTININKIITTFYDNQQNLWVGTWHGGINMLNLKPVKYKNYKFKDKADDLSQNITWELLPIKDETFLIGTNGNGICELNGKDKYFDKSTILNHCKYVPSFFLDKKEQILWVATWENGLIKYNLDTKTSINYLKSEALPFRIQRVSMDPNGILWIGTNLNGLYSLNTNEPNAKPKKHFVYANHNKDINSENIAIHSIEIDVDNTLWVGSFNHGLLKIKTDFKGNIISNSFIDIEKRLSNQYNGMRKLFIDKKKNIWIGFENGVVVYNTTTDKITELKDFKGLVINDFLEGKNQNIWIATHDGLYKYNSDSDKAHYFSGQVIKSIIEDETKKGTFWFTSNHGIYTFNLLDIEKENDIPILLVSSYIEDQNAEITPSSNNLIKFNFQDHLTKKYQENSINLKVSTLFIEELHDTEIQYKLENYDREWNRTLTNETVLSYRNIPPGEYRLLIKASRQNSLDKYNLKTLNLTILPPWWQNMYAKIIYLIMFISTLLLIRHTVKNRHRLKINKIKDDKEKELNNLKLKFFTNISHEVRTPLTLILGPIGNLLSKDKEGSWENKQHKIIQKNTDLLLKLVNQILDFRKLEKSKPTLENSNTNLKSLITSCINQFENMLEEKKIKILLNYDIPQTNLWIDSDKMEKVFINLFSNAIKYSDYKKNIDLHVSSSKKNIVIKVTNYGVGIANKDLPYVFDRFYQSKSHKGGTGIGLSLVKSFIELHKGTIKVLSDKNNKTVFTIKLPQEKVYLNKSKHLKVKVEPLIDNFQFVPKNDNNNLEKENTKDTILIIEDNNDIRNYIKEILEDEYHIVDVNNGTWGIEKAEAIIPQLVISDIMMDGIDGIEVCRILKSNIDTSHIPVILLTAKNTEEAKLDGYNKGADDFITKPFNTNLLKTRIKNLLEQRKRLKEKINFPSIEPKLISPSSIDEKFIKKTMLVLEKHISNNLLSVEDLAQEIGMTQTQFYRKIKNLTGFSASKFVQVFRLKRAAQMLGTNKFKVSEVLYEVGFSSPSYFTKCFKIQFGKSPTEFLENIKRNL